MLSCIVKAQKTSSAQPRNFSNGKRKFEQDATNQHRSTGSEEYSKQVVIVMDGLKEFTTEPLEWLLKNFPFDAESCTVTFLGVKPYLNIPQSSKTWSDIWSLDLEDLSTLSERIERKNNAKYQKILRVLQLCRFYGVKPQMRSEMGFPLQSLEVKNIISLHPSLIVFDRHHYKYRNYYAGKFPCNMAMMNKEGEVEMINAC